jgi:hypothetical protein
MKIAMAIIQLDKFKSIPAKNQIIKQLKAIDPDKIKVISYNKGILVFEKQDYIYEIIGKKIEEIFRK